MTVIRAGGVRFYALCRISTTVPWHIWVGAMRLVESLLLGARAGKLSTMLPEVLSIGSSNALSRLSERKKFVDHCVFLSLTGTWARVCTRLIRLYPFFTRGFCGGV